MALISSGLDVLSIGKYKSLYLTQGAERIWN